MYIINVICKLYKIDFLFYIYIIGLGQQLSSKMAIVSACLNCLMLVLPVKYLTLKRLSCRIIWPWSTGTGLDCYT